MTDPFARRVQRLAEESRLYFERLNLIPDQEDIWNDVLRRLTDETGQTVDRAMAKEVWKILFEEEENPEAPWLMEDRDVTLGWGEFDSKEAIVRRLKRDAAMRLDEVMMELAQPVTVRDPRGRLLKPRFRFGLFVTFVPAEDEEVAATTAEIEENPRRREEDVHRTWHAFWRAFRDDHGRWKWFGYELMKRVERWAGRRRDVRVLSVDDEGHASSLLVLVEHRTPRRYMGTSAVFIPQTVDEPAVFFLYPSHRHALARALEEIHAQAAPLERD